MSLEKLVKSLAVSLGIGAGILGFNGKVNAQCEPFMPDDNTVALFHLDEGIGTVTYDATGRYVGSIYAEENVPGPNFWTNGIFNYALDFRQPSVVYTSNFTSQLNQKVTVEAWIKPITLEPIDTDSNLQAIAFIDKYWFFGLNAQGRLHLRYWDSMGLDVDHDGNAILEPNIFSYVAFVFNGSTNNLKFYVDGILDKELESVVGMGGYANFLTIGTSRRNIIPGNYYPSQFRGVIDELKLSNIDRQIIPCLPVPTKNKTWGELKTIYR